MRDDLMIYLSVCGVIEFAQAIALVCIALRLRGMSDRADLVEDYAIELRTRVDGLEADIDALWKVRRKPHLFNEALPPPSKNN